MMIFRFIVLTGFILLYGIVFSTQEQNTQTRNPCLELALPANFYKIATGYIKQLAAEMLFIRTSVFLGGVLSDMPAKSYADALGNNFDVMTRLYPQFIDPYYFCQGFLPHISPEAAAKTNTILETGIEAYPDNFVFRMFHGTNFFLSMNEPIKGARAFAEAAKLPNAPPLFAHLSALLSAQSGDIAAGLIALNTMLAIETDEKVRNRYEDEIVFFERALEVQRGVSSYINKYKVAPSTLDQLVPDFLVQLPIMDDSFILKYDPPKVYLQRPYGFLKQKPGSQNE